MNHHAYLAQPATVTKAVVSCFYDVNQYADVSYIEVGTFGIDDVRALTASAYSTPVSGDKKLIVVLCREITIEAEQALLKILEEPPQTTVFLFMLPLGAYLLPTLLSRFYRLSSSCENEIPIAFAEFKSMKVADRISTIVKKLDNKDQEWVQEIKAGLLSYLDTNQDKARGEELSALMFVADYLQTRGASNKQLLEELALTLK